MNARRLVLLSATLALATVACAGQDAQPKTPLRDYASTRSEDAPESAISARARAALERGNEDFRAARFSAALEDYRDAAREAPQSAAPYYGILMAAQKLGDKPLADSASSMIRRLSGGESPENIHGSGAR